MNTTIALVGNPNSGKTTLFNNLTGSSQRVGNWPGVTVEKKEGTLKKRKEVLIQDLPGIYSLSPYTQEEVITRNYLIDEKPDVILNIVDATNIERNLYLTTQLIETGIPVVVALNMMDVVNKQKDKIDTALLSEKLGCPVIGVSAVKGTATKQAVEAAIAAAQKKQENIPVFFTAETEAKIEAIETAIKGQLEDETFLRWYAIKFFEQDEKVLEQITLSDATKAEIAKIVTAYEDEKDDDAESIITDERYVFIADATKKAVKKGTSGLTTSDKIDRIVTNRWLALPIFALVMFLVYYISISSVGGFLTDWTNDVLFGEIIPPAVGGWLESINTAPWLYGLIMEGIIGGVGAVLGFLPQMLVLFVCLAILEDCGYMARIAFIMDRVFRRFGLSGKSFIPILIGTGCGVPGIMASRTIENEQDRRMTVITTTFIPCAAKLPIIALISGAMFDGAWWVAPLSYFIGIAAIIISGIILKKTKLFAGDPAPFIMELPAYHMPRIKGVLLQTWERGKAFLKKAGTIIFISCGVIWFLSAFNWSMQMVDVEESMLASIGRIIAPIFAPLGWGDWKPAVATFNGLIAKEVVVGTFGILYGFGDEISEDGAEVWGALRSSFTPIAGLSFLVFQLLCAPCFAAIGAIRREMGSAKWTWTAILFQTGLAYAVSFIIYQFGSIGTNGFGLGTVIAILVTLGILYLLFRPAKKKRGVYGEVYSK